MNNSGKVRVLVKTTLLLMATNSIAAELKGKVVDAANISAGIAGVSVIALGRQAQPLGNVVTDATGHFQIDIDDATTLQFDKIGYINRKAKRRITALLAKPVVILARDSTDTAYLKVLGERFAASDNASQGEYASVIAALPANARKEVLANVSSSDKRLALDGAIADRVNERMLAIGMPDAAAVAKEGEIRLEGFVRSAADAKKAVSAAKATAGPEKVRSELKINAVNR